MRDGLKHSYYQLLYSFICGDNVIGLNHNNNALNIFSAYSVMGCRIDPSGETHLGLFLVPTSAPRLV